ncbi:tyrosine-type recombinase/integrase [Bacillus sp. EB01]|uniref:tyrosine-type recombinase/integrase n=1 Tax=Bacillus sp. EB01 TaxID=1347086 RepID=UPI0005C57840|nr:site-specific integrase [Bacillus sp. EB01]
MLLTQQKKLDDAFKEFLVVQSVKKGLKERTVREHKVHFDYFKSYLKNSGIQVANVNDVTDMICAGYWEFLRNKVKWSDHRRIGSKLKNEEKGLSQTTINIRTRTLKAQFNYYKKKGYILDNPWQEFNLRHEDATPRYWSKSELFRLLDAINADSFEGERDRALYLFLLDTGARIGETLQLNEWNFDLNEGEVHFPAQITKNGHPRTSPLGKDTVTLLQRLFKRNSEVSPKTSYGAFITGNGTRITYAGVRDNLVRYAKKAKLDHAHFHQFRHSFAVHYTLNGGDEVSLMQIGGWRAQQSLRRYRTLTENDLKKQHQKFAPVNSLFQ